MKKRSSSRVSRTDWRRVRAMQDKEITLMPEHPEVDVRHIVRGTVRRGLKPVPPKASIALRVDADVLDWFKAQGPGYQTRINAVLRAFQGCFARWMTALDRGLLFDAALLKCCTFYELRFSVVYRN